MQKLFFLTIALLFHLFVIAQQPHYKQFDEEDGLPVATLYSITEDSEGSIWITSAEGIARYNGQRFERFTTQNGLLENDIWGIFDDGYGHLWLNMAFNDALKVQYFDIRTHRIVTLQIPPNKTLHQQHTKKISLASTHLRFKMVDKNTVGIFLGTYTDGQDCYFYAFINTSDQGVKLIDPLQSVLSIYKNNIIDAKPNKYQKVIYGFTAIDQGQNPFGWRFWAGQWQKAGPIQQKINIADATGLLFLTDSTFVWQDEQTLSLWHKTKGKQAEYKANAPISGISSISVRDGIFFKTSNRTHWIDAHTLKPQPCLARFDFLKAWQVHHVIADRQQNVWVVMQDNSVRMMSKQALLHTQTYAMSEAVRHITKDPLGRLWYGTQTGRVGYFDNNKQHDVAFQYPFGQYIRGLECMPNGDLWIANDKQLLKINVTKPSLPNSFSLTDLGLWGDVPFKKINNQTDFRLAGSAFKSLKRVQNELFLANNGGGDRLYPKAGGYVYETVVPGRCYALQPSARGFFVGRTDGVYLQSDSLLPVAGLPKVQINDLALVKNKLYVATAGAGLYVYNIDNQKVEKIIAFANDNIHRLRIDENQHIWVCSKSKGLLVLDNNEKLKYRIGLAQGLPSNEVFDVWHDNEQTVVATAKGITFVSPQILLTNTNQNTKNLYLKSVRFRHNGQDSTWYFPTDVQTLALAADENTISVEVNSRNPHHTKNVYSYTLFKNGDTLSTISKPDMTHELRYLEAGNYDLTITSPDDETVAYRFRVLRPFYQQWWFWLVVGSLMAAAIYYRVRLNMKKASLELRALQGQMNAHFAANFMEVVKNLVLRENKMSAFNSLSMFGGLMRDFVVASRNKRIPIGEEAEFLKRYIELARLVYNLKKTDDYDKTLTDSLTIDPDIDPKIFIRPLLVQPIVENAFKYGVFHKEAPARLTIRFEPFDAQSIKCTIEDDGVGRKRVAEIQAQEKADLKQMLDKAPAESKGSIQSMREAGIKITITDLPQGTKIEIILEILK